MPPTAAKEPNGPKEPKDDTPAPPRLPEQLEDVAPAATSGDLDWTAARISGDFSGRQRDGFDCVESHVLRATFTGSDFVPVRLSDAFFEDCELSGVVLQEASLSRVVFSNCRMSGIVLAGARLRDVVLTDFKLDEANLLGTVGERWRHGSCVMTKADFSGAR